MSKTMVYHIAATCSLLFLSACASMAPEYQRPAMPVAGHWAGEGDAPAQGGRHAAELPWRQVFADSRLQRLIELALAHNRDLQVAVLNIEKARAQYRIQRAGLLPQIEAAGSGTAQRTPAATSVTGESGVSHAYGLEVGLASYELDLFGRVRSLRDEALQSYLATEETRRSVHIALVAEVADAWLALVTDRQLLQLAERTLASREGAYALQQARAEEGNASQLDLRQAEREMEQARAQTLAATQQAALDANALELLVGLPLDASLLPEGDVDLDMVLGTREIPAGLPSAMLQARPDILAAEHRLMAANAHIGAARAAFFPTISLTAATGRGSDALSSLFDAGGRTWRFVPQITLPIFTGGRLQAELEVSEADRGIAVAEYEQAIQTAFREVADALARRSTADATVQAQSKRAQAAAEVDELVRLRYDTGVSDYLEVLDAQRTLYAAQQDRLQAEQARQGSLVSLYRALGGGWLEQGQADAAAVGPSGG